MNATNFRSKTLLGCVFATTLASAAFNVGAQSSVHSTATANAPPLSLSEAFNIAYRNAPELQAQVANAEAARAMGLSSLELPDPKLKFGIENLPLQGRNQFRLDRDDFTFTRIGFTRDFTHAEKRSLRSARFGIEADKVASVGAERRALIRRELALATVNQHFAARAQELVQALTGEARILVDVLIGQVRTNRARALDAGASQTALRALQDREAEIALQATRAAIILRRWLGDAATRTVLLPSRMDVNDDQLADHLVQHPHLRGAHLEVEAAHKEAQLATHWLQDK